MSFGWLSLTALSFMLASPSWGTLLDQITGVLTDPGVEPIYISIPSAIFMMLAMGFGFATIFGIMLGRGYSEKEWRIRDFVIILAAFYIFDLVSSASVSHWVLNLVQPEAGEYFERGLKAAELDLTPYKAYLEHFKDDSWAKKLEGGRNYFASIQAISSVFRSLGALIATRFIVRDKRAANTGFAVSAIFALSITACDLFMYFGSGGYHKLGENPFPSWIAPWSEWEYFTGFFAGLFIMIYLLSLKKQKDVPEIAFEKMSEKAKKYITCIFTFVAMIGINVVRPVIERLEDWDYYIPAIIASVLAVIALIFVIFKKFGFNAKKLTANELYRILLPIMIIYITVAYLFIAMPDSQRFREMEMLHNIMVCVSAAAVLAWNASEIKKSRT